MTGIPNTKSQGFDFFPSAFESDALQAAQLVAGDASFFQSFVQDLFLATTDSEALKKFVNRLRRSANELAGTLVTDQILWAIISLSIDRYYSAPTVSTSKADEKLSLFSLMAAAFFSQQIDEAKLLQWNKDYLEAARKRNNVPGVREAVLQVIIAQASAGAAWKEVCALPMLIHEISSEEVEEALRQRETGS